VCEGGGKDEEHPNEEEELEATQVNSVGGLGVAVESNGIVPAEEDEDGHE
jgi:hypothetical protein